MVIANGSPIFASDLNPVFADGVAPVPSGVGLSSGLDAQKDLPNGYSIFRFREKNMATGDVHKIRFTCPDNFDIYAAGLSLTFSEPVTVPPLGGVTSVWTAAIQGNISDLQNNQPVTESLFLNEPVSNTEGERFVKVEVPEPSLGVFAEYSSTRYATYDLNNNRPCNTLLKGAMYEVILTCVLLDPNLEDGAGNPFAGTYGVDFYVEYKTQLRRV